MSREDVKPKLSEPDKAWVDNTMKSLNLRDKVAQLIKIRVAGRFLNRRSPEYLALESQIRRNHVGGVILFAGNIYESAILLNELQHMSQLPLLVAADFERGASFRIADTTSFPWTMAIGATGSEEFAYQQGAITAQEARALGVHWVYAPVMDVNNNPDNPVINIRSFGEDPHLVARLGTAFIRGSRDNGVLTTAKHFPGHGDTATDSHIGLAVIPSDQSRLDSVELVPFRQAIEAGVDAIMTAHVAVPRVTGEPDIPATLSAKVLTDLLRNRLKFDGLVITDAMEMGGITTRYGTGKAAIRAVQAGADMLLLPPDTDAAIEEITGAVERGEISEKRIDQSVERILATKSRLRLQEERTVPIDQIASIIATPENQKLAQEIADRSMTLLKDEGHLVPIDPARPRKIFSLMLSTDLDTSPGALFQSEMRRRFPSIETASMDPRAAENLAERTLKSAASADLIVVSTIVRVITGTGGVGLPDKQRALVERLFRAGKPVIWVAFGNPYVLRSFPRAPTYLCTFSYSDVSYIAAARALSGEIPISGKMPVSIPGLAKVGNGLQVAALAGAKK
jgi:beta-glucosidase-like glycosyl hydrolase